MSTVHKLILYGLLGLLGLSLLLPGLWEMFRSEPGTTGLTAANTPGRNQWRGLNGMLVGLGVLALWACWNLEQSRSLVLALGVVLAGVAVARLVSLWLDGWPGTAALVYLGAELTMATVFLLWPPPV